MAIADELRKADSSLWERMVTHPFVVELGDGSLPLEKFRRYFLQDYLFLKVLAKVVGTAVARAPSLEAARPLSPFLDTLLNAESTRFFRAFQELGVPSNEYLNAEFLPTTQAMASFMLTTAHQGSFEDILALLLVTEWTYNDWATRLAQAGKHPPQRVYQEWIDIHAAQELGDFVAGLKRHLDAAVTPQTLPQVRDLFRTTLRYEYLFWEMAYHGEAWP